MPGDVNPFEPWRPRRPEPPEREVAPGRPWRPSADQRPEPAGPWEQSPPPWRPRGVEVRASDFRRTAVVGVCGALFIAGAGALAYLGGNHVSRVGAAVFAVGAGLVLALRGPGRGWRRGGWAALGLAAGVAAWLLVPTTGGLTWLGAERRLALLKAVPPGDLDAFAAAHGVREELLREFPTYGAAVRQADDAWGWEAVMHHGAEADRESASDPDAALARLDRVEGALAPYCRDVRGALAEPRRRARHALQQRLDRHAARAEAELRRLLQAGRAAEVPGLAQRLAEELDLAGARLEPAPGYLARFREVRRAACRARLEAARDEVGRLLAAERYGEALTRVGVARRELWDEAEAIGLADELEQFRRAGKALGHLARAAGKVDQD